MNSNSIIKFPHLNGSSDGPHQPDRLTPQSLEAEQSTLGAMLLEPSAADEAMLIAACDDFYRPNHQLIYAAIATLRAAATPVDVVTVCHHLQMAGELEDAGGIPYIGVLLEACPSAANVAAYATVVHEHSIRRKLIHAATTAANSVYSNDPNALAKALRQLQEAQQAASTGGERFKPQSWQDLKARPKVDWMIDGLLLERSLAVMFGAGATFKSFLALDIALHLATGRSWHGRPVLAGTVVYAAGEGVDGLCARLDAWTNRYQVKELPHFYAMTEVPRLCDEADVSRLLARLKSMHTAPRLVIIDTLAWAMEGADENNTGDMTKAVSAAKRIRDELGCAVLIVHHTNKSGLMRGNEALRNNVDCMIETRAEERRITLHCNKQKDRPNFADLTFLGGVVEIDGGDSLVFEPTSAMPVGRKLKPNEEKALDILQSAMPQGLTWGCWKAGDGKPPLPHGSFTNAVKALKEFGLVELQGELYRTIEPR